MNWFFIKSLLVIAVAFFVYLSSIWFKYGAFNTWPTNVKRKHAWISYFTNNLSLVVLCFSLYDSDLKVFGRADFYWPIATGLILAVVNTIKFFRDLGKC